MQNFIHRIVDTVKMPFRTRHISGLHTGFSKIHNFSFAVIVTERKYSPRSRKIASASSATVRVIVFAVR